MPIDFSDPTRRDRLKQAAALIAQGYGILAQIGATRPSDNAFLREAIICAQVGLIWAGERSGVDARHPVTGAVAEIKSTQYRTGQLMWSTSRYVSPEVIRRFRAVGIWLFGVFDPLEQMVALYQANAAGMAPHIDVLERQMLDRQARKEPFANNPHITLDQLRPGVPRVYIAPGYREVEQAGRWRIVRN